MEENYFTNSAVAQVYDSYIGLNMPFYWPAIHCLADTVGELFHGRTIPRALEIGVGSGNLSLNVLERVRIADLTILDHSEEFLRIAESKLSSRPAHPPGSLKTCLGSFSSPRWSGPVAAEPFDLVLSSFTLDHIADSQLAQVFYEELPALVKSGGVFTLAEKCASNDRNSQAWKSYVRCIDLRTEHNRKHGLKTEEEIKEWRRHNFEDDQMRSLLLHAEALERAGFRIHKMAGVPLPAPDAMEYDSFYQLTEVRDLSRDELRRKDQALGVGVLVAVKV